MVSIVCLVNTLTSSLWTDSTRQDILHWAPPSACVSTMCLPDGTARDQISRPGLPLPYFILEERKYWRWERGYVLPVLTHCIHEQAAPNTL